MKVHYKNHFIRSTPGIGWDAWYQSFRFLGVFDTYEEAKKAIDVEDMRRGKNEH